MARYYFHVRRGRLTIIDHRGVDLSDLTEATKEAARRAQIEKREPADVSWSRDAIIVDNEYSNVPEVPLNGVTPVTNALRLHEVP